MARHTALNRKRSVGATTLMVMAAILAIPVCAVVLFVILFDANAHKATIEAAVARATGRNFAITGKVAVASFTVPTLAADGLVLGNMATGSSPDMMKVGRVEADLAIWPLLAGRIEIARLVLHGADLLLERDAGGRDNWHFVRDPGAASPSPPPAGDSGAARPAQIGVRTLHVRDGRLHFIDWVSGRAGLIGIKRLAATQSAAGERLQLTGEVLFAGREVALSGQSGTFAQLLDPAPAVPFGLVLTATAQGGKLTAAGSFAAPLRGAGYRFRIDGSDADAAGIAGLLGVALPKLRNLSFGAELADRPGGVEVTGLVLRAGASELEDYAPGLKLEAAEIVAPAMDQPLRVQLRGTLSGTPLSVTGEVGTPTSLMAPAGTLAIPLNLAFALGQTAISAKGSVKDLARLAGADLAVLADIADLQSLGPLAGTRLPALRNIHLEGRLADAPGGLAQGFTLSNIALAAPQADLHGELSVAAGRPTAITSRLRGRRIELDPLLEAFKGLNLPGPPAPTSNALPVGTPVVPLRRLAIPDNRLALSGLERLDLDAKLALGELVLGDATYTDLAGEILLKGGRLTIAPFTAQVAGGKVDLALTAESKGTESPLSLKFAGPGLALKPLLAGFGRGEDVSGTLDLTIEVRGRGETPHAIAGSLDGVFGFALADGEIDNGLLSQFAKWVMSGGRQIPYLDSPGRARLRCAAIRLNLAHGVATSSALMMDTQRLLIQASGQVDLQEEAVALRLRPLLRTGGPAVVVPLRIDGRLGELRVGLDAPGAAEGAAAAPPGKQDLAGRLAALGGVQLGERGDDACPPALALARGTGAAAATPAPPAPAPPRRNPADLLRQFIR